MSQYFKYVNESRNEWISLPGPSSPIEQLTNPVASAVVAYVLYEGPMDGTAFRKMVDRDSEEYQQAFEEMITRETRREDEQFEKYMDERPNYIINKFEREHQQHPDEAPEAFKEFCRDQSRSVYRKANLHWDRDKMHGTIAAGFQIDDLEFAGRWAGDPVQLVGDYAESELYDESRTEWVYEDYETGEEFVNYATSSAPVIPDSIHKDGMVHSIEDRPVEAGDLCHLTHPETGDKVYAHFVREAETEWDDITDGVLDELVEFVGDEWVEEASEIGRINPSMVLRA